MQIALSEAPSGSYRPFASLANRIRVSPLISDRKTRTKPLCPAEFALGRSLIGQFAKHPRGLCLRGSGRANCSPQTELAIRRKTDTSAALPATCIGCLSEDTSQFRSTNYAVTLNEPPADAERLHGGRDTRFQLEVGDFFLFFCEQIRLSANRVSGMKS